MNYKRKTFLLSLFIILSFILSFMAYMQYIILHNDYLIVNIFLVFFILFIVSLLFFYILSKPLLDNLFKSDDNLQQNVEQTLHEINIPIATIKMNTQILEKNLKNEKNLLRLHRITLASNNLLELYENMEYKIKKEIDNIETTVFYLSDILQKSIKKFEDIKNDIKVIVEIENIKLNCDLKGFEIVLDNLISNAIKYNIKTNGTISIKTKNTNLYIYNTGKEIDTKNLFIIFDKYYQENSIYKGLGLGLGLYVVKEFCDKHKIIIKIKSNDKGNTFILDLKNIIYL